MKLLLSLALCIATIKLATAQPDLQPAPDFSLTTTHRQQIGLKALKGQIVLLNFWATWCAPCVEELPALAALAATYRKEAAETHNRLRRRPSMKKRLCCKGVATTRARSSGLSGFSNTRPTILRFSICARFPWPNSMI